MWSGDELSPPCARASTRLPAGGGAGLPATPQLTSGRPSRPRSEALHSCAAAWRMRSNGEFFICVWGGLFRGRGRRG